MQPDDRQSSERTLERATQLLRDGNIEGAIDLCADILRHDPKHAAANLRVGIAAQALGNLEVAEKHFRVAIKNAPNDSRPLISLVQLLIDQGRLGEAERMLKKAISSFPYSPDGHHWLGRVRHLQMDFIGAAEALNRAASISPEDEEICFHLGRALAEIGSRAAEAAQIQRHAIELGGFRSDYLWPAVNWHLLRGELEVAEKYVRALIDHHPTNDPAPYYSLGKILNMRRQEDAASNVLKGALERCNALAPTDSLDSDDIAAYRGRILHEMGEREQAAATFRDIGQITPVARFVFDPAIYCDDMVSRIRRLQRIVAGRDVVVLCHGPTVSQLERVVDRLIGLNICFVSFNRFAIVETHLLSRIGRHVDIIAETSATETAGYIDYISAFLDRDEDNLMLTSRQALSLLASPRSIEDQYDTKLLFFEMHTNKLATPSNPLHFLPGNTLSVLLPVIQIARPSRVFLFGADGHVADDRDPTYYRMESREFADGAAFDEEEARSRLTQDTNQFNDVCDLQTLCFSGLFSVPEAPVYNCSQHSHYRPYPRMTVADGIELLNQPT